MFVSGLEQEMVVREKKDLQVASLSNNPSLYPRKQH